MRRPLPHYIAFFVGLAAVCWVGVGYLGTNPLALAMTLLIGAFYGVGALELQRFDRATSTLTRALADLAHAPANFGAWLDSLHPSLRNAVRLRVEGERVGLPGPALTPYLAGLLVLLGMLGTFLGMVVTLNGTGIALESASDLSAIRASLAAPVKGLGLAFGTSLAGVAASAMLGLVSALCRRDRLQSAQLLDTHIGTTLRIFSLAHRRDASFRLLQQQAEVMPQLADRLQAMMAQMERHSQALNARLLASQDTFHGKAEAAYAGLANAVDRSLKDSLTEGARIAGATIQPVVEATMAGIARETTALHASLGHAVKTQLDGLSSRFEASTGTVGQLWQTALAEHRHTSETLSNALGASLDQFTETFAQRSASLVDGVSGRLEHTVNNVAGSWRDALTRHAQVSEAASLDTQRALTATTASFAQHTASLLDTVRQAHADLQAEMTSRDQQRLADWTDALATMAHDITTQAEAHAKHTMTEIGQLVRSAAEAPRAAADVIVEFRQKWSDSVARDNAILDERSRILAALETLLHGVNHASAQQRGAIDALVATSADLLDRVGSQFTDKLEAETGKMTGVAAQLTGSAIEVASLGESFGAAVQLFSESSEKLGSQLKRIEGALGKSMTRSDEQLAYYVAQAKEVVDLSLMSQQQIVEELQRLASQRALAGSET